MMHFVIQVWGKGNKIKRTVSFLLTLSHQLYFSTFVDHIYMCLETNTYFINSHWSKTSWPEELSGPISSSLHPLTGCLSFPRLPPSFLHARLPRCPSSSRPSSPLRFSPLPALQAAGQEPSHTLNLFGSTVMRPTGGEASDALSPSSAYLPPHWDCDCGPGSFWPVAPSCPSGIYAFSCEWGTVTLGNKSKYSRCNCNCAVPD